MVSKGCRVGGSGVDAFVSDAVVSGSVVLGWLASSSKMLELWCQEGCRVGGCYVEVFVSGAVLSGDVVLWLLCRGVRVGGLCKYEYYEHSITYLSRISYSPVVIL